MLTQTGGIWTLYLTAGKGHVRGFMAFDGRGSDIGHGVGWALHGFFVLFDSVGTWLFTKFNSTIEFSTQRSAAHLPDLNFVLVPKSQEHVEKLKKMGLTEVQHDHSVIADNKPQRHVKFPRCQKNKDTVQHCATPSQRQANTVANVGPTPVKGHEAAVMALAGCLSGFFLMHRLHFLICSVGITYTRHYLDDNSELGPVQRMSLGFNYFFADWITKAFDKLLGVTINNLSEEDEQIMGWPAYRALAKVQAKVLDARLNLVLVRIPNVNVIPATGVTTWGTAKGSGLDTAEKVSIHREEDGLVEAAVEELLRFSVQVDIVYSANSQEMGPTIQICG
ncbi:hypothetical protein C8F04DRAFT_1192140 [Mycena alexandri]|uniref:Uncharacterized protein n=1 Tax=Mycena alexandri TaxID=1745969 RepID=A0AAD6SER9_9AGAR|nr:hypothetical protein C8F04DRAFT_1192140 [Mycena alexandri]